MLPCNQRLQFLQIQRDRASLFEPDAVIDWGGGRFLRGYEAIRSHYADVTASGRKFAVGEQRAALVSGDLALTSTRFPDGDVTS